MSFKISDNFEPDESVPYSPCRKCTHDKSDCYRCKHRMKRGYGWKGNPERLRFGGKVPTPERLRLQKLRSQR